jgi:hypothetical protein
MCPASVSSVGTSPAQAMTTSTSAPGERRVEQNQQRAMQICAFAVKRSRGKDKIFVEA